MSGTLATNSLFNSHSVSNGYEEEWNNVYGLDRDPVRMQLLYPWVSENLDLTNKVILDAGCGNGSLGNFLRGQKFKSYLGVDVSNEFLDFAIKNVVDERITFIQGNLLEGWGFPDESFDIVFSVFVINEIENLDFFFLEASRVLKSNGCVVVFLTHPFTYMYYSLKERFTGEPNKKFSGYTDYFHSNKVTYHFTLSNATAYVYPYTISEIFNSISNAQMFPSKVSELTTDAPEFFYSPSYKETSDIPKFLALKLVKGFQNSNSPT